MTMHGGSIQSEQAKQVHHEVFGNEPPVRRRSLGKRQLEGEGTMKGDPIENATLAERDLIKRRLEALAFMQKCIDAEAAARRS